MRRLCVAVTCVGLGGCYERPHDTPFEQGMTETDGGPTDGGPGEGPGSGSGLDTDGPDTDTDGSDSSSSSGGVECDPAVEECDVGVVCTEHSDCTSGACRFATQECFGGLNVLRIVAAAACDGADGSEAAPFCTIDGAVNRLAMEDGNAPWMLRVSGSLSSTGVILALGHPLAVVGTEPDAATTIQHDVSVIQLLDPTDEVYVSNLSVIGDSGGFGTIMVEGGRAWIDDSIVQSSDVALSVGGGAAADLLRSALEQSFIGLDAAANSSVRLDQSRISDNHTGVIMEGNLELVRSYLFNNYVEGGVELRGSGSLRLENSISHGNIYNRGTVEAQTGSTVEVLYSTIFDSFGCDPGTSVTVRNSVVWGNQCPTAIIDRSAVDVGDAQGLGNAVISDVADLTTLFVDPQSLPPDLHVIQGNPYSTVALWSPGDPDVDIDGDSRPVDPTGIGTPGADEP